MKRVMKNSVPGRMGTQEGMVHLMELISMGEFKQQ